MPLERPSAETTQNGTKNNESGARSFPSRRAVGSRAAFGAVLAFVGAVVSACTAIGGIDDLQRVADDASAATSNDATVGSTLGDANSGGTTADGASTFSTSDGGTHGDGGAGTLLDGDVAASSCTPDPAFCGNVCGDATDNCGQIRHCSADCGQNNTCNTTTHKCECVQLSNLCDDRCGTLTDNCGQPADCGNCPSDGGVALTCTSNSCGCNPDAFSTTCGSKNCGTAVNNCGQTVFCGGNVTTPSSACANSGDVCLATDMCCTPDNVTPCSGKCGGQSVTNNCGQTITCPTSCPSGEVCTSGACCTPSPDTCDDVACGTVTNNCGQAVACPNTCFDACPNGGTCIAASNSCRCTVCANKAGELGPDIPACPQP